MAAAKWALEGVSESLAAELKPLGIKVIIVQPGPFRTEFSGRTREKPRRRLRPIERQVPSLCRNHERQATRRPGQGGGRHHRRRRIRRAAAAPGPGKVRERQGAEKTRRGCKRTRRVGTSRPRHGFHTQPMNATKMPLILAIVMPIALGIFWLVTTSRAATELPNYKVVRTDAAFEIRDYPEL